MRCLGRLTRGGSLALGMAMAVAAFVAVQAASMKAIVPAYPASMAALGDSITQAFDSLGYLGVLQSEPQLSWATGYASAKTVDSQYLRLLVVDPKIKGHGYNDAVVGARVGGLGAQVAEAVKQKAQYVVILMGANDACTRTIPEMTPVATFSRTFAGDLATLMKGLPKGAHVFVSSIPNLFQLWSIFHADRTAEQRWALGICQSMLSPADTPADRLLVLNRERSYNAALASSCGKYPSCRWDGLAVFDYKFTRSEVNALDYYHPDVQGQNRMAAITWAKSWWPRSR